jgi:hypothetical protein
LKYLSQQAEDQQLKEQTKAGDPTDMFIHLSIDHSHRILSLFLAMSDLTAFVRPAYENLLCSFAMVTLSEFAAYLEDAKATLAIMEKTSFHVRLGGKAEPVSKWALNVLRKYVFDIHQVPETYQPQNDIGFSEPNIERSAENVSNVAAYDFGGYEWGNEGMVNQEFPSLEDMFLAS